MTAPEPNPTIEPAQFRRVMGRFATGLTVITAKAGGEIRGMTASAFMSGSLNPPLLVVSIAREAHMHEHLMRAGRFAVNILGAGENDIAMHFAGRRMDGVQAKFTEVAGTPTLAGASAVMTARTIATHECGDHTLFVAHILTMASEDRPPLIYHAGRFASLVSEAGAPVPEFW